MKPKLVTLLLLPLMLACGNDGGPAGPGDPDPPAMLPPDPDGMLLEGDAGADARAATVSLAPSPVPPADIDGSLLRTRLAAVIAPGATVGAVNAALTAENAAIVSMVADDPYVVLVIEAVADPADAEARAADLVATGAFVYARPGLMNRRVVDSAAAGDRDFPAEGALDQIPHLKPSRVPAAWNLRHAASGRATLIVPDWYADIPSYTELPQLEFAENAGRALVPGDGLLYAAGNLGFHRVGVAAANWTYDGGTSPHTGADPVAEELLEIIGINTCGLDESEVFVSIVFQIPLGEPAVVLDTSTFDDPEGIFFRYLDRAWLALRWRRMVYALLGSSDFLHVVAAGQTGESGFPINEAAMNSSCGVATAVSLPVIASLDADEEELAAFQAAYDADVAGLPIMAQPLPNVLLVGSSNASGEESAFSTPQSQVRTVGEGVVGPCLVGDDCDGVSIGLNGTPGAAAQVAGLAAYLWHLDPLRSVPDLLLRLQHAYSASGRPGILDASIAALSLDDAVGDRMRKTLLDISGPNAEPDGAFTEHDIEAFLAAFDAFAGAIEPDWSAYDLNGDGWTAGPNGARMDLDVNILPGFTMVDQLIGGEAVSFDEAAVTDEEVLCYYAYSSLYSGNAVEREALLGGHCGGGGTLPVSRAESEYSLDVESYVSEDYDSDDDTDLRFIEDFGDYATTLGSTISIDGAVATGNVSTTTSLHREEGGTVTLAIDFMAEASIQWGAEGDNAQADTEGDVHVGLEVVGEYTVTVSGRLSVDAPGELARASAYVYVGPDSTLHGWSIPGGGSWRLDYDEVEQGILDIEIEPVTIPDGTHRIWVNVSADAQAGDESYVSDSGSNAGSSAVENLLIVLTPVNAMRASARVVSGR